MENSPKKLHVPVDPNSWKHRLLPDSTPILTLYQRRVVGQLNSGWRIRFDATVSPRAGQRDHGAKWRVALVRNDEWESMREYVFVHLRELRIIARLETSGAVEYWGLASQLPRFDTEQVWKRFKK